MKKLTAMIVFSVLMCALLVTAIAAPSPTTSATVGGIVIESNKETIEIPKEDLGEYVEITHVHEAKEGSDLEKIGEALSTDDKIADVIGGEYDGNKLIQLFEIATSDKIEGTTIKIDGKVIELKDGKFVITIDAPSFTENMNVIVSLFKNGQWVQSDHARAFNGYLTIELNSIDELNSIYAVMVEKPIVSPPTGETANTTAFVALVILSLFGIALATKKYLLSK
jgi:hypothetical protein